MDTMALRRADGVLEPLKRKIPIPSSGQMRVRVSACGVCRTDLHLIDGELPNISTPIVPGHEIVGVVDMLGDGVSDFQLGDRVGIPWLGGTCGKCWYCQNECENLCEDPEFTGYTMDGGYAEYAIAQSRYCFPLPDIYSDYEAAPLLCAGLIGYRCLKAAGVGKNLGLFGFGAAAHICIQIAHYQERRIFAFTRPGDKKAEQFALDLGAYWVGSSTSTPPQPLDAAIIFAPVGSLVPAALRAVRKGGTVVCGGIHMSDIPSFPYEILWGERVVRSIANLTRKDAIEFLELAPKVPVKTHTVSYALEDANAAIDDLRDGRLSGAAVLIP